MLLGFVVGVQGLQAICFSLVSGGVAGMAGSFSSQPLDLVRTRMVMQRNQPVRDFLKLL